MNATSPYHAYKGYLVPMRSEDMSKHLENLNPMDMASQEQHPISDDDDEEEDKEYTEYILKLIDELGYEVDDFLEEQDEEEIPDLYMEDAPTTQE